MPGADPKLVVPTTKVFDKNSLFCDQLVDYTMPVVEKMHVTKAIADSFVKSRSSNSANALSLVAAEAMKTYVSVTRNVYSRKDVGKSMADQGMPCECSKTGAVCGDDHRCINRIMFMECIDCSTKCRNKRFQLRQYAQVDVIYTGKKGLGLIALTDLPTNAFVMEYVGEVISRKNFLERSKHYEAIGLKHCYFMTLKKGRIIDATRKGGLARFINHSCNPNCVTQKWAVGGRMRIGIFTRHPIKAGTELTIDYKFERYGAIPQTCHCGESNCKGYIGSSYDEGEPAALDESGATGQLWGPLKDPNNVHLFVDCMLDSVGKPELVIQLVQQLELTEEKKVLKKFVGLHGLKLLKFWLGEWKHNNTILLKVLQVLSKLPVTSKNGLHDAQLFDVVGKLTRHPDGSIQRAATQLLEKWHSLEHVYRIPKYTQQKDQKSVLSHEEKADEIKDPTSVMIGPVMPALVLSTHPDHNAQEVVFPPVLPTNWMFAFTNKGDIYYYHQITGKTQWQVPQDHHTGSMESMPDLQDLVEKTIRDKGITPPFPNNLKNEVELKIQVSQIVISYLISSHKDLWGGDRCLFKELLRRLTHNIVMREIQSQRFIDSHDTTTGWLANMQSKRKQTIDDVAIGSKRPAVGSPVVAAHSHQDASFGIATPLFDVDCGLPQRLDNHSSNCTCPRCHDKRAPLYF